MARLELADRRKLPEEFKGRFDVIEQSNGYIPNSYLLLAHRPPILQALMDLSKAVIRDEGTLDRGFRFLIAYMSSRTAGCQFCQAHNISSASRWGISDEKLNAIWEYETSPLFNEGERAALLG
jgi:alkylhydroperoxidase family enzyme